MKEIFETNLCVQMSSVDGDISVGLSSSASVETTSPISVTAFSPCNVNEFTQLRSSDAIESGVSNLSSPSTTRNSSSTVQTNSPKSERIARKCVLLEITMDVSYATDAKDSFEDQFGLGEDIPPVDLGTTVKLKKCFTMGMKAEAVQLERDRDRYSGLSTPSTSSSQWVDSVRDDLRNRNFKDSSVQTNITMINDAQNEPVKPTPCRLNVVSNSLVPAATHDVEQLLLDELISVENEIWSLRDTENIVTELKPFGQLNVKFDVAYSNPELLNFSGSKILDSVHFIDGWRRGFTWYIDYTRLLKPFARLSYNDQICLSKRRLVNVSWLSHLFHSYLNGHDGIALANGHYHPHSTDPRSSEADPVMSIFSDPMMPMVYEDILRPFRSRKFDFNEFVLMKCLIMFRDEFFLTEAGLKTVREIREQYSKILYNYVLRKCGNDVLEAINRFTEILGFIGPVLHLTARLNERVQMSVFFNILDLDPLLSDCHHPNRIAMSESEVHYSITSTSTPSTLNSTNSSILNCNDQMYTQNDFEFVSSSNASSSTPEESNGLKFCTVCGDTAFGNHYGTTAKVSFDVAYGIVEFTLVDSKTTVRYEKVRLSFTGKSKEWQLTETRNACRQCRLNRCISVGMRPDAVQFERDQGVTNVRFEVHVFNSSNVKKELANSSSQTDLSLLQANQTNGSHVKFENIDVPELQLALDLIDIERDVWKLQDNNSKITELMPMPHLNFTFEIAFANANFVSRRYPLQFTGSQILTSSLFIDAWRRSFVYYVDFIQRLPAFKQLDYADQLALARARLTNSFWWTTAYYSYVSGKNGLLFANGTFHPNVSDVCASEADPVVFQLFEKLMPIAMRDLIQNCRRLNLDFVEYIFLKVVIILRDEFFLSPNGLKITRESKSRCLSDFYKYTAQKFAGDIIEAVNRYMEILNLIPPILFLSSKLSERIETFELFDILPKLNLPTGFS
ncbi:hypothetical protein M3Y98_00244500 [Aphelenchoides besseyi]|nr:hypothetical protein M3Y98_00244500 [Aphelenchoides besseyi]KAI6200706.1 hypothetical protein M3Y96_00762600 [Aphelenchoides besseyi]